MKELFRKEIKNVSPYVPGKPIEEVKKEYNIERIDKLASNENPLGPSPKALAAVKGVLDNINIYPDAGSADLRAAIAAFHGLESENIVVGSGGEQILDFIARTFINAGDQAIMAETTFGLYASSIAILGGVPVKVPMKDYKHDFAGFVAQINQHTKIIYVCNPNNPLGNIMTAKEISYLVEHVPQDIVIVFDEAYYEYAKVNPQYPDSLSILRGRPNTVILRTFSKIVGLAGLRVGYALTSKPIVSEMMKIKPVFNVNRIAQTAAIAALSDHQHIKNSVKLNYESLQLMENYFKRKGFEYVPPNANFVFVNVGKHSKIVFEELMKRGTIIRPGFLWGYDNWLRVSTGTLEQTERFIAALEEVLESTIA